MDDSDFDRALIASAFDLAGRHGWRHVSVAEAARAAGLPLPRARARFPGRAAILLRFGVLADQAAVDQSATDGSMRDRLFDMLMRRFDVLQAHRAGVLALLHALPAEPDTALLLALATRRSMRWLLDAAGIDTGGINGRLHANGLVAVWLWAIRTWRHDESPDMSATMSALDHALDRAGQAAQWLPSALRTGTGAPTPEPSSATTPPSPAAEVPIVPRTSTTAEQPPEPPIDMPPEPPPSPPPVV